MVALHVIVYSSQSQARDYSHSRLNAKSVFVYSMHSQSQATLKQTKHQGVCRCLASAVRYTQLQQFSCQQYFN